MTVPPPAQLTGLVAAAFSPLDEEGRLNLPVVDQQAALFQEMGLRGVWVAGTTGECHSLSLTERLRLADSWLQHRRDDFAVIVHVGCQSLPDSQTLAGHAQESGADAIAIMPPAYFKPVSVDDVLQFMEPIASAAPATPLYYYDIPRMTEVRIPTDELLVRGRERIPTLCGAKFSNENLTLFQQCLRAADGGFNVLFGSDPWMLAALALGATGFVGSTYNLAGPHYLRIMEAFQQSDWETARSLQAQSVELVAILLQTRILPALKALMRMMGVPVGPVRPPLTELSRAEEQELYARVHHLDLFARPLIAPE